MKKTSNYLALYVSCFVLFLISAGILISCDSINNDVPEESGINYSEKIADLNNLFQENNIDIKIRDIKPADRDLIETIKRYNFEKLSHRKDHGSYSDDIINWNKTEVLSTENYEMYIAITKVRENPLNGQKYLFSLMNEEGVFMQFFNNIPDSNLMDDAILKENFDLEMTFTNIDGSCLLNVGKPNAELITSNASLLANSESDGCWENCVVETIQDATASFLLFCMATGPFCAAATAIACAGYCVMQ